MTNRWVWGAVLGPVMALAGCDGGAQGDATDPATVTLHGELHHAGKGGARDRRRHHAGRRAHPHHHGPHHGGGMGGMGGDTGGGCPETPAITANLNGVFSVAEDDVWAVGAAGTILHYDGCWTSEASPTTADLLDVWAASDGDVWAVADLGTMVHRQGGAWVTVAAPIATDKIVGVWGAASNDVWAVTQPQIGAVTEPARILHWDGGAWTVAFSRTGDLWAISGRAADDVYAVGGGHEPDGDYASLILHWDGVSWTEGYACNPEGSRFASGGFVTYLQDVWATPGGSVWGAGNCFAGFIATGYVARGDGTAFAVSPFPRDPQFVDESMGERRPLNAVFAASDSDVWAGSSVSSQWVTTLPTALHFDGTTWSASTDLNTMGIGDLGGTGSDDVWAVGAAGKRLHFDGTAWAPSP